MRQTKSGIRYLIVTTFGILATALAIQFVFHKRANERIRGNIYSVQCFSNMLTLANMLGQYAKEHGGKLPERAYKDNSGQISWVQAITPYLIKRGYNIKRKFHCPLNARSTELTDYTFNASLYGKSLREILRHPDIDLLSETGNRHYLDKPLTVAVDMLRPYLN